MMAATDTVATLWQEITNKVNADDRLERNVLAFLGLAEPKGVLGDTLYIEVPNELTRQMIDTRIRPAIVEAIQNSVDNQGAGNFAVFVNPEISVPTAPEAIEEPVAAPVNVPSYLSNSTSVGRSHETRLNPKYNFDNFVTGSSNRFANAAAFAVAETPAKAYNPLFIYGNSGLGKTHLLHAIGHYALSLYPKIKVRYVSSEEFTNDFINAIQNNRTAQFQAEYREVDILLIDDIQFLQGKDQTQEAFFHTFNTLTDHNKQVVITSDLPPKMLTGFEERLTSRFESGLSTDIHTPELETRIAILRKKAENEKLRVPEDVLEFMATRVSQNVRELEGALIQVTAFAALNRSPVDMALVQTVLKHTTNLGEDTVVTAVDIVNAVSAYYRISSDEIYGKSRTSAVATARQIAFYLCRTQTNLSLPKIGQIFGNRDHTTVLYGYNKIADEMKNRRELYNQVSEIINRVKVSR
jgi:chromosomal replication initiator protein